MSIALLALAFVLTISWFESRDASGAPGDVFVGPQSNIEMGIDNGGSINSQFVTAVNIPSPVINKPFVSKKWYINSFGQCSCVEYVKARLDISGSFGNAWNVEPDTKIPKKGLVILFKTHVGYVVNYDGYWVTYDDYNWIPCKERRSVKVYAGDESIRGYALR